MKMMKLVKKDEMLYLLIVTKWNLKISRPVKSTPADKHCF